MAYRRPQRYFFIVDLAVEKRVDRNRSLALLKQLNHTIDWNPIDQLFCKFYHTDKAAEGGKVDPPRLLFKCLLLQKWFQIPAQSWKARSMTLSRSKCIFLFMDQLNYSETINHWIHCLSP